MDSIKRLLAIRFRISTQLYTAFGVAVAFTVAASLVAWFSLIQVSDAQTRVNEGSVPEIEASFGMAEYSSELVAAAPRLTAATDPNQVEQVWKEVDSAKEHFNQRLNILKQADPDRAARIAEYTATLENNIRTIHDNMEAVFDLNGQSAALVGEMEDLRSELERVLIPTVDDELFFILTGRSELGSFVAPYSTHFSDEQFGIYRHLSAIQADINIAFQQLSTVFSIFDPALVEAQEERFESTTASIQRHLASLNDDELEQSIAPLFDRLLALGLAEDGIFEVLRAQLRLDAQQSNLLEDSRAQSVNLLIEVDTLVSAAVASADAATQASDQAITTGGSLLLAISVISVGGALLISWLFVGRVILYRINILSGRMREMAEGKLEEEVVVEGHDELAEMAAALEVFRNNSLEALRLNLVEELNQELEGKNTELETVLLELDGKNSELEGKNTELEVVLSDLQKAQDQIVMREKLAALGEVTAGVAHEIRNPLNFVKNFSEVSEELLTEMREALEEGGESPDVSLISDISNDLTDNLVRIRHHGDRANRIVHDMLLMGRGTSNWQGINLNTLLVEHSMLAYHSARATDSDFQLTVEQDLDEEIGEVQAIPQDLSRTFLNIVGNACQATDERRRDLAEQGVGFDGYRPTVWLKTRDLGDDAEISIRDNGIGMPEDVAEKIFNPFFTTKPANQGTGLGLAITSDIIRQHGGTIRVKSEVGEFTEMIIVIPKTPPDEIREAYGSEAVTAD